MEMIILIAIVHERGKASERNNLYERFTIAVSSYFNYWSPPRVDSMLCPYDSKDSDFQDQMYLHIENGKKPGFYRIADPGKLHTHRGGSI
jgi:hypothetical protein